MNNKGRFVSVLFYLVLFISGCVHGPQAPAPNSLYQVSTISALMEGAYEGVETCGDLLKKGDFGLGTFDALDGEMIALDGRIYRISANGKAAEVQADEKSPFAAVTFFRPGQPFSFSRPLAMREFEKYLDGRLPSKNIFYAVRMDGEFSYVKTRSVPRQSKPYARLIDVVKKQPVFEFRNVKGTLVALRCPEYVERLNVAGYHFHFITAGRDAGGHVLEFRPAAVRVEIAEIRDLKLVLPKGGFDYLDLTGGGKSGEIYKIEK